VPLIAAMMSKWFKKNRGFAISLALSGNCIGQFILVPLFNDVVLEYGWRASYLFIGLIILVVNTTLVLFVIKGDPEDQGVESYLHQNPPDTTTTNRSPVSTAGTTDLSLKEAMKTSSFWLFLIVMFVCGSGDFLVTTHLVPMVTDFNISPAVAADMLGWFGLLSMGGMLVAGPASDRIGSKVPIALTFVLRLVLFFLILHYHNLITFYTFAAAFGFTFLITAPLTTTLVGKLYGFSHLGLISGFITMVHHLGGGLWAYLGGLIFDKTGSYYWCFIISAGMAGIAVVCTLLIKERRCQVR
jgi:MFS family permease